MPATWFQSDPNRLPDSAFEPGALRHLCVGNEGRRLDFRRTPIRIERLHDDTGLASVQILAFEDKGAVWDLPYEEVNRYQFALGSSEAFPEALERIHSAIARHDREVHICRDAARQDALDKLSEERARAAAWLGEHSAFFRIGTSIPDGQPQGSLLLYADTSAYMTERGLGDIEALFTRQYVTYMGNEAVKAHRIAQSVPVQRLFMTYLETEALNHPYRECEAVLLADPANRAF